MASNPKSALFGRMMLLFGQMKLSLVEQLAVIEKAAGERKLHTQLSVEELRKVLAEIGADAGEAMTA